MGTLRVMEGMYFTWKGETHQVSAVGETYVMTNTGYSMGWDKIKINNNFYIDSEGIIGRDSSGKEILDPTLYTYRLTDDFGNFGIKKYDRIEGDIFIFDYIRVHYSNLTAISECKDCGGTRVYIGLNVREACKSCCV
jgi:hypothetical protein